MRSRVVCIRSENKSPDLVPETALSFIYGGRTACSTLLLRNRARQSCGRWPHNAPARLEIVRQRPTLAFRVLIIGGTGQVGAAVVRALVAEPSCAEVVMVNRKAIPLTTTHRLRQVILDTAAPQFPAEVTKLARSMVALGDPVYEASCVGVGKDSMKWSEEELKALEIGVVGGFARGCHAGGVAQFALLSAAGSTTKSRIRYVRVMGLKEETVQGIGFKSLAIFRPGIIAGNAHTPCCLVGASHSGTVWDD
jgi:hypothetical protein